MACAMLTTAMQEAATQEAKTLEKATQEAKMKGATTVQHASEVEDC